MGKITIGGKEYTLRYGIQASMHSDCVAKTTMLMTRMSGIEGKDGLREFFTGFADMPSTALHMLYAGLIEHHGVRGDRTVMEFENVYELAEQYFEEHKEDGKGNFFELFLVLSEAMGNDGFFDRIGLGSMMEKMEAQPKKQPKTPQDHKKKTTRPKTQPKTTEE